MFLSVGFSKTPNNGTPYPYCSHTTPIFESLKIWEVYGNSMGPAYHKEVPCPWGSRGVITLDFRSDGLPEVGNLPLIPLRRRPQTNGRTNRVPSFFWLGFLCYYLDVAPLTVTVTTMIMTFLVGNPYKPSFTTVTVRGPHPSYYQNLL